VNRAGQRIFVQRVERKAARGQYRIELAFGVGALQAEMPVFARGLHEAVGAEKRVGADDERPDHVATKRVVQQEGVGLEECEADVRHYVSHLAREKNRIADVGRLDGYVPHSLARDGEEHVLQGEVLRVGGRGRQGRRQVDRAALLLERDVERRRSGQGRARVLVFLVDAVVRRAQRRDVDRKRDVDLGLEVAVGGRGGAELRS